MQLAEANSLEQCFQKEQQRFLVAGVAEAFFVVLLALVFPFAFYAGCEILIHSTRAQFFTSLCGSGLFYYLAQNSAQRALWFLKAARQSQRAARIAHCRARRAKHRRSHLSPHE